MNNLIPIIVNCGVGADLFSLPLLICTCLISFGFKAPPENLSWLGSWWAVGIVGLLVVVEVALDTMFDRRKKFFRNTWPTLQFVMSAMISVVIVLTLGSELSAVGKVSAIGASWVCTGILKIGLVENFRKAFDFLGN